MNPNERRRSASIPEVAENANVVANARQDGEIEFGDFEGFEDAAVANIPAAAGPSPWATFPDLLPVQTSPANPTSDELAGSNPVAVARGHENNEPWLIGAVGGAENPLNVGLMNPSGFNQVSTRAVNNPPDISLISACCTSASGVPFNGLDPVSGDPRQIGMASISELDARHQRESSLNLQISDLRQHVEVLTSQRLLLEQQLSDANRERQRMAENLRESESLVSELQAQQRQVNERHEVDEQLNASVLQEFTATLNQIRESVESIKSSQAQDQLAIATLQENFNKLSTKRPPNNISEGEEANSHDQSNTAESSDRLEHIIQETVRKCLREQKDLQKEGNASDEPSSRNSGTMEELRTELHLHAEQIQELLETERCNYKAVVNKTLQTALKQLSSALSSINLEEDNCKASNS